MALRNWIKRAASLLGLAVLCAAPAFGQPATISRDDLPPKIDREFRAAWVATVSNIDWPSKPGLPVEQQKAELTHIFNTAAELNLNAVIFQIRTSCDALYDSKIEPWSEYLTGQMGKAPQPLWDPLATAVKLAHDRGIELHAWFNPYRARHTSAKAPVASRHISKTRPELVRTYGTHLWLDPADKRVREYTTSVVLDVVRRYDIDAVHMDDYFYPYVERDSAGQAIPFPDDATWARAQATGVKTSREDWRRHNVNLLMQELYQKIHATKKHVRFGLSPFGIWRPGNPQQIRGLDAYSVLYADAKLWWNKGWVDYFAPQLYWAIEPPAQSYPVLLDWWVAENTHQRHLYPGNASANIDLRKWPSTEIANQIALTRKLPAPGHIHWNMSAILKNHGGLADMLRTNTYKTTALVPATTWIDAKPPAKPTLTVRSAGQKRVVNWKVQGEPAWLWVVQTRRNGVWSSRVLPRSQHEFSFAPSEKPQTIAVTAVDRLGNASPVALVAP